MEQILAKITTILENNPYVKTIAFSLLLFIFLILSKKLAQLNLSKRKIDKSERILLQKKIGQYLNYLFLLFLFILWFSQLQIFFVSLFAVAAAIVLAFKELIMCVTGGIYLRSSGLFKEGHRIDIAGVRGFVIEKLLITTRVLEIGPENNSQQATGDVISIPNSVFLTQTLKNESYFKGFSIKSFQFKVSVADDIDDLEQTLLTKSKEICSPYIAEAKRGISKFCEREGIVIPSVDPRTKIIFDEKDKVIVLIKLPVQNFKIADTEQELNRLVLDWKRSHL